MVVIHSFQENLPESFRQLFKIGGVMFQIRTLAIALLLILSLTSASIRVNAQTQGDAETAIERATELSKFEENGDAQALYRLMHPDSKAIVLFEAVDGWYRNDFFPLQPHTIKEVLSIDFVSWTWDVTGQVYENTAQITFIQPFGPNGATTDTQETIRLVQHDGSWKWFFGRSAEFVNQQIQNYPAAAKESTSVTRAERPTRTANSTSATRTERPTRTASSSGIPGLSDSSNYDHCNLVELYPGYPLYRGNITGVMGHRQGLGDFQCLEDLEANFPAFEKLIEDGANLEAARELGIDGKPHQWTWENWLQIEAARGLQPACYSCLMIDPTTTPLIPELTPDPSDSRIRLGFLGDDGAIRRLLPDLGLEGAQWSLTEHFNYDSYELRATAYSYDARANADELFALYDDVLFYLVSTGNSFENVPGFYSVSPSDYLFLVLEDTGGYTHTPDTAWPNDQILLLGMAIYALDNQMSDRSENTLHNVFDRGLEEWKLGGYPAPLADFLREGRYFSGF